MLRPKQLLLVPHSGLSVPFCSKSSSENKCSYQTASVQLKTYQVQKCRWSQESAEFLRLLAQHKARSAPAPLQQATVTSLISRWSAILAHAGMHAFAASLLSLPADGLANGEGVLPPLGQLLAQPEAAPTNPSRLPGR